MSDTVPRLADSSLARETLARAEVLYTDLDGTLLGRGGSLLRDHDGTPSLAAASAIVSLAETGREAVIVSARTRAQLREIARLLGWTSYLAEMGTVAVYDRGSRVERRLGVWDRIALPTDRTPHRMIEDSGAIEALFDEFEGALEHHTPYHHDREVTHLLRGHVDVDRAQEVLDRFHPPIRIVDNGIVDPPNHGVRLGKSGDGAPATIHAYHVMPKGAGKTEGIDADLRARGVPREHAVLVGDALADLETHPAVGLVVLVANALRSERVARRLAEVPHAVVTDSPASEGFAEVARAWIGAARG